jgi:HD-like signal output (HDOD) protein
MKGRMMNANILETIKKSAAVPSMPQVVLRFLEIMQDPEFNYADLVKALSADAGTVSELLRLANSALFGVRNKVASPRQALTLLGPKRTRSLLLGRYLVDTMSSKRVSGLDMSYFWRRSLTSSLIATHLAEEVARPQRDEAFIGALLADIGIPILAEAMPSAYAPVVVRFAPHCAPIMADEEIEAVEVTHAQVSAMVLSHWTLPSSVSAAVNLHQSDTPGDDETAKIARILNASDTLARMLCEVPDPEAIIESCTHAMEFVGASVGTLVTMLPSIEAEIEELADALRIDVIPSSVYSLVAQTLTDKLSASAC